MKIAKRTTQELQRKALELHRLEIARLQKSEDAILHIAKTLGFALSDWTPEGVVNRVLEKRFAREMGLSETDGAPAANVAAAFGLSDDSIERLAGAGISSMSDLLVAALVSRGA